MNRVRATLVKPRRFRIVSDEPLTNKQIEIIQEKLGFPPFPFQPMFSTRAQRKKMGKNTLLWSCYDV